MKNNNNNQRQNIDIAKIQTDVDWIKSEVSDIKDNHLHEIRGELKSQKLWLIGVLVAIITLLLKTYI
jgi:hypothetical protein